MVQGYLTLQEAAQHLNITVDELKQMAQKGKIRSFQDKGTLRFRQADIHELARQRGVSSDPDLVLGEASLPPKKGDGPRSPKTPLGPKTPSRSEAPEVFDFELSDSIELGGDPPPSASPSKGGSSRGTKGKSSSRIPQAKEPPKSSGPPKSSAPLQVKSGGPKSGAQPKSGAPPKSGSAREKPSSDSDVKLVASSRDDVTLSVAPDSDIKLRERGSGTKTPSSVNLPARGNQPPTSDPTKKRHSKLGPMSPPPGPDSGVRLIAMDSDSDVKIVPGGGDEVPLGQSPNATLADSNVRLEKVQFPPIPTDSGALLTEEINLDEELRKEAEQKPKQPTKVKPKSQLKFPTTSPFELSDSDVNRPSSAPGLAPPAAAAPKSRAPAPSDSSDFEMTAAKDDSSNFDLQASPSDSSNFELKALKDSSGNFDLAPSDDSVASPAGSSEDDFSLELEESESALGDVGGGELTAPASGISLSNPTDAGISLEDQQSTDDSVDFDLSLEPEATPKPAQMKSVESGDQGSSEFELSLELPDEGKPAAAADDSDSEFELTLDDSSSEMDAEQPAPALSDDETTAQDIFESDFEIPALQEEGGSEAGAPDSELESSDFDLALDDSELAADEESGSQVVALDEEEVEVDTDEEPAEVKVDDEGFGDLEAEGEGEAEVELDADADDRPARVEVREKLLKPAPWGPVPAIVMFPCVIVMLLVGLVGFEVVQSSIGQRPPGFMTRALNDNLLVGLGFSKPLAK